MMGKKLLKYVIVIVVIGLLGYNSVHFKKLDAKNKETVIDSNLSPAEVAQNFWTKQFPVFFDSAVAINTFSQLLKENPKQAFAKYAHSQGIGNANFFLVKGEGIITTVTEDEITVATKSGTGELMVKLNTGIYFGNAVRDVTGKISMGDFNNTMDFNTVSTELNKIVKAQVVLPLKHKAKKGDTINFVGCIELSQDQTVSGDINILPVKITF